MFSQTLRRVLALTTSALGACVLTACGSPRLASTASLARDGAMLGLGADRFCFLASTLRTPALVARSGAATIDRAACEDSLIAIHTALLTHDDLVAMAMFRNSPMLRAMMDTTASALPGLPYCTPNEEQALTGAMQNVLDGVQGAVERLRDSTDVRDDLGLLGVFDTALGAGGRGRWSLNAGLFTLATAKWCETVDAEDFAQLAELFCADRGTRVVIATVRSYNALSHTSP